MAGAHRALVTVVVHNACVGGGFEGAAVKPAQYRPTGEVAVRLKERFAQRGPRGGCQFVDRRHERSAICGGHFAHPGNNPAAMIIVSLTAIKIEDL